MILYFLRHELAGDRSEWTGDDRQRPLTREGQDRMARSSQTLAELKLGVDLVLTSPLTRALQTAEIAAEGMGMKEKLVVDQRLSPGFNSETASDILADYPQARAILFVGHEPDFSETVSALTGGSSIVFKKGGRARVDLPGSTAQDGELVWLIPPKILARGA